MKSLVHGGFPGAADLRVAEPGNDGMENCDIQDRILEREKQDERWWVDEMEVMIVVARVDVYV